MLQNGGTIPFLQGTDIIPGLARYHMMHTLQQNKGVHIESATGKDTPRKGDKPIMGCVASLSLGKEVFQDQAPFLIWPSKVKRLNEQRC